MVSLESTVLVVPLGDTVVQHEITPDGTLTRRIASAPTDGLPVDWTTIEPVVRMTDLSADSGFSVTDDVVTVVLDQPGDADANASTHVDEVDDEVDDDVDERPVL